jgi:hypothetical protein
VTVVVPTHDHGATLQFSVQSALDQEVEDIEVVVVGDGAPPVTTEIMAAFVARDHRVRFIDNPKGAGNGESHRQDALAQARGAVVAYLADDDLWHRTHLTNLLDLLQGADFAHTLPLRADPDGSIHAWAVDLSLDADRRLLLEHENRVPLAFTGHTMDLYRRLPAGWRAAPPGSPSDLHFYRQVLRVDGCRAISGMRPTALTFPSPDRRAMTPSQRVEELGHWAERVRTDWPSIVDAALQAVARERAAFEAQWREAINAVAELEVVRGTATWRLRERFVGSGATRLARGLVQRLAGRSRG